MGEVVEYARCEIKKEDGDDYYLDRAAEGLEEAQEERGVRIAHRAHGAGDMLQVFQAFRFGSIICCWPQPEKAARLSEIDAALPERKTG